MPREMVIGRTFLSTRRVLEGAELEAYDRLYKGAKTRTREIILSQDVPNDRIHWIFGRLFCDAPGIFWLGKSYSIIRRGSETAVVLDIVYTVEEANRLRGKVIKRLREIGSTLPDPDGDIGAEIAVHDLLTSTVRYVDTGRKEEHSIIGPLLEGRGVCEGISASFNLIMNSLGIDCMTIDGHRRGELHAWNVAYIGGRPCHVDVTSDLDGSHAFLNVTDGMLEGDREWNPLVRCDSGDLDYHAINGTVLKGASAVKRYLNGNLAPGIAAEFRTEPDLGLEHITDIANGVLRKRRLSGGSVASNGLGTYTVRADPRRPRIATMCAWHHGGTPPRISCLISRRRSPQPSPGPCA